MPSLQEENITINDLINKFRDLYNLGQRITLSHQRYLAFKDELTKFIYSNHLNNTPEWETIYNNLVIKTTQYMSVGEFNIILTQLEKLQLIILENKNEPFWQYIHADSVKLKNGYLVVEYCLKTPAKLINKWYKDKALSTFEKELDKCFKQFIDYKIDKPYLKIRKLTKRWGSYNKNSNTITMNIEAIKANKDCIDYIIYHELCHCMYFAHNKEFYTLLESKCKDWSKLKNKLEMLTL